MPLPCRACRRPVHETVVTCPHCAEPTGVVPDKTLTGEEAVAATELARIEADRYVPTPSYGSGLGFDPEIALLGGAVVVVGAVVKSAVEAVIDERRSEPEIPRAIARERTGPRPVVPDPSREPEPAPPPAEKPRFLK